MKLNGIEEILDDMRQGRMVILMDDEDRENEGDLIIPAERITPEAINFMAKHARGLICLTLTEERCRHLDLPLMVRDNNANNQTNFTLSIEAATGVTTGISAADRARTILTAVDRNSVAADIVQPGHIFPLMAEPGGVLSRAGHTEAGCDLARLAGYEPAAVIVEIMNDDGTMSRRPDLEQFAEQHGLKIGTIADLIHYRTLNEKTVERIQSTPVTTVTGEYQLLVYQDTVHDGTHLAMVKGDIGADEHAPLVRVHVPNTLRDLLGIALPSGSWPIQQALERVSAEGAGVVLLLDVGTAKRGLSAELDQYLCGAGGSRPPAGGSRGYLTIGTGSQILRDIGVEKMRLLSKPMKFNALSGFGLEVVEYIPYRGTS